MNYYLKRVFLALTKWIPDEQYTKLIYLLKMHEKLELDPPKSFPEKIQWLKLYGLKPEYEQMADKIAVRRIVRERIGEQYLAKLYGVFEKPENIKIDDMPQSFVLKCTHDSGSIRICHDKSTFDFKEAKRFLNRRLKLPFYLEGRENVYRNIKPRVVCEELLGDGKKAPCDYKLFCFNGEPELIMVDVDRFENHRQYFYDKEWKRVYLKSGYKAAEGIDLCRPKCLMELLQLAREMSKGIPFVRSDFYIVENKIFFGEMTFYHGAGLQHLYPKELEMKYAEMILIR